jgi:succinate dehydrogenase / fumarate reductase flavoprotein subunit
VGESDYQYHGANRLGANSLLSCIYGGLVTGDEIPRYISTLSSTPRDALFTEQLNIEKKRKEELLASNGCENPFILHDELSQIMVENVTTKRNNKDLEKTYDKILEIKERLKNITLSDRSSFANQTYIFANQLEPMLDLSLVITKGAYLRNESRGSHFKEEFPDRDDEHWLKTTVATYDTKTKEPKFTYEPVDIRHFPPHKRDYSQAVKVKPKITNMPKELPSVL